MKGLTLAAALALLASYASAGSITTNLSGTIAVTNTFQSVAVQGVRNGCEVQNNGTHTMYVFFGPIASATTANSVALAAGQGVGCGAPGVVLSDQISITGTAGDAFYAGVQQ